MIQDNPQGDVVTRIQQVTEELRTIQEEIFSQLFPPEAVAENNIFLEMPSSAETVIKLKAGIDELRHTLWLYIDAVLKQPEIESERQNRLLLYATEMLRSLSNSAPFPHMEISANSTSFVTRLLSLVNSYMENQEQDAEKQAAAEQRGSKQSTEIEKCASPDVKGEITEQKTVSSGPPVAMLIA